MTGIPPLQSRLWQATQLANNESEIPAPAAFQSCIKQLINYEKLVPLARQVLSAVPECLKLYTPCPTTPTVFSEMHTSNAINMNSNSLPGFVNTGKNYFRFVGADPVLRYLETETIDFAINILMLQDDLSSPDTLRDFHFLTTNDIFFMSRHRSPPEQRSERDRFMMLKTVLMRHRYVFFIYHQNENHWIPIVIKQREAGERRSKVFVYDSLQSRSGPTGIREIYRFLTGNDRILESDLVKHIVPVQTSSFQCGIHAIATCWMLFREGFDRTTSIPVGTPAYRNFPQTIHAEILFASLLKFAGRLAVILSQDSFMDLLELPGFPKHTDTTRSERLLDGSTEFFLHYMCVDGHQGPLLLGTRSSAYRDTLKAKSKAHKHHILGEAMKLSEENAISGERTNVNLGSDENVGSPSNNEMRDSADSSIPISMPDNNDSMEDREHGNLGQLDDSESESSDESESESSGIDSAEDNEYSDIEDNKRDREESSEEDPSPRAWKKARTAANPRPQTRSNESVIDPKDIFSFDS